MKPIDKIKNLKEQLSRKKDGLGDIDYKIEQLIKERTKRGLETSRNFNLDTRLEMDIKKERALKEITDRINHLNKFKSDVLGEIANLDREIAEFDEPKLLAERERAKKEFNKLTVRYLEILPELHVIGSELVDLAKKHGITLPSTLKCKKLAEYQKTVKDDKPNLKQLIYNCIGILGVGCWGHYTIQK